MLLVDDVIVDILLQLPLNNVKQLCQVNQQLFTACHSERLQHKQNKILKQIKEILFHFDEWLRPSRFVSYHEITSLLDQYTSYKIIVNPSTIKKDPESLIKLIFINKDRPQAKNSIAISLNNGQILLTPSLDQPVFEQVMFHILYDDIVRYHGPQG